MSEAPLRRECPVCHEPKPSGIILCVPCWDKLHPQIRQWLSIADVCAEQRQAHFYSRVAAGADITKLISMPGKKELMRDRRKG
jgi:hypothetical protein